MRGLKHPNIVWKLTIAIEDVHSNPRGGFCNDPPRARTQGISWPTSFSSSSIVLYARKPGVRIWNGLLARLGISASG
jgi:hypothetical protein